MGSRRVNVAVFTINHRTDFNHGEIPVRDRFDFQFPTKLHYEDHVAQVTNFAWDKCGSDGFDRVGEGSLEDFCLEELESADFLRFALLSTK